LAEKYKKYVEEILKEEKRKYKALDDIVERI
jgi:hypothetical protein